MAGTINLYSIGLNYASATSSSAIFNIVPVVAFILAVMFRSDKTSKIRTKRTHCFSLALRLDFWIKYGTALNIKSYFARMIEWRP
jgi:hypothetical protein